MDRKIIVVGVVSFVVVALAAFLTIFFARPASFRGTMYTEPYPAAPDFSLTMANGETYRLGEDDGKITLLFFGYTYCPDVCPTTLAELKLAMDLLRNDADRVQVVFISVDPERDTTKKVQEYVQRFNPNFIGLSGSLEELEPVWNGYGVYREVVEGTSESNYIINHTARVTLVDQNGNMRLTYGFQTPPEDIARDIEILLKQ